MSKHSDNDSDISKDSLIASFDIGIKNLAVCVLNQHKEIKYWNVLNTLGGQETKYCKTCNKKATFCIKTEDQKNQENQNEKESNSDSDSDSDSKIIVENWYCRVHDPKKKERTQKEIKKAQLAIRGKKVKSCTTQELNEKVIKALDSILLQFPLLDAEEVVIELQPRFNPKMKQISQTVYSYFLIRGIIDKPESERKLKTVKFIAAKNKLKLAEKIYKGPVVTCNLKSKYGRTKFYSKVYTEWILRENEEAVKILKKHKDKSDDLCDCFLQGMWYLS